MNSGVTVNAAGSSGSSGKRMCLESFFKCFAVASGKFGARVRCQ